LHVTGFGILDCSNRPGTGEDCSGISLYEGLRKPNVTDPIGERGWLVYRTESYSDQLNVTAA
jgi:hypothetical protein